MLRHIDAAVKGDHGLGEAVEVLVLGVGVEIVARILRVLGLERADRRGGNAVGVAERQIQRLEPRPLLVVADQDVDELEKIDPRGRYEPHAGIIADSERVVEAGVLGLVAAVPVVVSPGLLLPLLPLPLLSWPPELLPEPPVPPVPPEGPLAAAAVP